MVSTFLYGENVHANGIRQHFLRFGGAGTKLVLVPGITSPAITWGFVAERLGEKFDVYVLDVRGRGLSQSGEALDYGIDACAKDVAGLVDVLGLTDYALMGHSFGARIAVKTAARYPRGLARLVMIDPPVSGPNRRPYPAQIDFYVDSIRRMSRGDNAEAMRAFMPTWSIEQLRLRAEWLHTCDIRAVIDAYNDFHIDDMHSDLPFIRVPSMLLAAGRGDVIRPEELAEIVALMPGLTANWVPTAGHMIPWDDEAGFYASLGDFLGEAIPASRVI